MNTSENNQTPMQPSDAMVVPLVTNEAREYEQKSISDQITRRLRAVFVLILSKQ